MAKLGQHNSNRNWLRVLRSKSEVKLAVQAVQTVVNRSFRKVGLNHPARRTQTVPRLFNRAESACREEREYRRPQACHIALRDQHRLVQNVCIHPVENLVFLWDAAAVDYPFD